jgi:hypothetical protein
MVFRIALIYVLFFTTAGLAADLYVAPGGDDRSPGTMEKPLQTLPRARDVARQQDDVVNIILREGTYQLEAPLKLRPEDSAAEGATITYSAAPGEDVLISGGRPIGPWRKEGELLVADVPEADTWRFRELFVGGERRPRARHPNEGYFRVVRAGADNRMSFTFAPGDLATIAIPEEAEMVFLHDWSISRVRIKTIDAENNVVSFTDPIGASAPHYRIDHFESHPRYFVENAREYLDAPGEWFLDVAAGKLFYLPREGETAENLQAVAPRLARLVEVQGDDAKGPVRGVRFKDLTFAHCRFDIPRHGYAEGQATFYEDRDSGPRPARGMVPAALAFDFAEGCVLENCRLEHLGGSGVYFRQECHNNRVTACSFNDIAGNGAMFGEVITRLGPDGQERVCRGNEISDCTIERCGELFYGAVGVWVGIAQGTTVAHNEIRNLPYTGVSVGWKWDTQPTGCRKNSVRDNHIHQVMQKLSDGGGIYTLGLQPGTVLAGNRIHDVPLNLGRAESNGMFIDEGSSQITIENNTIFAIERSPIRFHRAERDAIRNNRLVCAAGVPPFRYNSTDPATMTFENNAIIETDVWTPPADDPTATAGPRN